MDAKAKSIIIYYLSIIIISFSILKSCVILLAKADRAKKRTMIFTRCGNDREETMEKARYLILEDGHVFKGKAFGAGGQVTGEIVFTTAMTGYLETLTWLYRRFR
jgi:hypothetical protein